MGSNELDESDVEAVLAVVANVSLASIDYYEVSASRLDEDIELDEDETLTISVQYRATESGFGVRLLAEMIAPHGRARACVAGEYQFNEGFETEDRACQLFVNEVGVMTVYPYLREALATTTARVFGEPLHLPMIERGDLRVEPPDAAPEED